MQTTALSPVNSGTATVAHRPITMSLSVRESGDQSGRWLYSSARSVEGAVRCAVKRCLINGYALGESLVTVWEGEHATPVNALRLGQYRVVTKRGQILSVEKL